MKINSIGDADIKLVLIGQTVIGCGRDTPHCKLHGAMNKMTKEGIWRCVSQFNQWYDNEAKELRVRYNTCMAGCEEVEE